MTANSVRPEVILSPRRFEADDDYDPSLLHLNSLLPRPQPSQRPSLWPLTGLEEDGSPSEGEWEGSCTRPGAKVAIADLYDIRSTTRNEAVSTEDDGGLARVLAETSPVDPTAVAQRAVLHTAELLEIVLASLPSIDLWQASYVCRSWSELVSTSPTLRRRLGFTSDSKPGRPEQTFNSDYHFAMNPVLDSLNLIRATGTSCTNVRATINFPARWRTVKAPWRDLQICEPPIQRMFLQSSWLDKYLECETGITAGMVADRVELSRAGVLKLFHSS